MSKYKPLGDYLASVRIAEVRMGFSDIERILGFTLPEKAQAQRAWWSNNPSNNVMTRVWLDAGFQTERVDLVGRRLVFRRTRWAEPPAAAPAPEVEPASPEEAKAAARRADPAARHPLLGALKGMVKITPGLDLTQPADPYWGVR